MKKAIFVISLSIMLFTVACPLEQKASNVKQATVEVSTGVDGLTVEQKNIKDRLEEDMKPGSIKHLYIISAYSGQVIMYSTVKGKVTSSGKRLLPYAMYDWTFRIDIRGENGYTNEILQDDGTYGSSIPYLYWWDSQGRYHQHFVSGGQIIHISNEPISVKSVIINVESGE